MAPESGPSTLEHLTDHNSQNVNIYIIPLTDPCKKPTSHSYQNQDLSNLASIDK